MNRFTNRLRHRLAGAVVAMMIVALAPSVQASQVVDVTYNKQGFSAQVQVNSLIELELHVRFEEAIGVSAENFDLNFQIVSPLNLSVTNRLSGSLVSLPTDFPVLITIKPKEDKGFSFSGVAEIEVYTKNLHYIPGSPLRLFHSSNGGQFRDITVTTGAGSYRARGQMGTFSDFLIVTDLRTPATIVSGKVSGLRDYLQSQSQRVNTLVYSQVDGLLATIQQQVYGGQYSAALATVNELVSVLESVESVLMPNIWRSSKDLENVQGNLLSQARSLRYSLRIL